VNFKREEDAKAAKSALNGFELQKKHLKVSVARAPSDDIKHTNLYVTNLPRSTSEPDLLQLFQPYGKVIQKKLLFDKYTKLPRGVAFVRYETREQASNAIQALHELIPEGHIEPIRVRLADDHGKRRASYLAGFQAGMGISSARSSTHNNYNNPASRYKRYSRSPTSTSSHNNGTYSSKIDHNHDWKDNNKRPLTSSHRSLTPEKCTRNRSRNNTSHLKNYRSEKPYHR